jgi:ribosomal protein S18 acetylase RimI-like enzyme
MADFPPEGYSLELLNSKHRRKDFASGDEQVDRWLIHKAAGAMKKNTSTTRVLVRHDGVIAGYYTLANSALDVSLVPAALFEGNPPSRAPPVLTLAWLGVDTRFTGLGFGTKLFARALADGVQVYELVRFVAVIVDALTESNIAFYQSHGFVPVPGTTNKLYMPATTLLEVVAGA